MELSNTKKELRKIVVRFAIVFFIVLIALTFFSKTVERLLLPKVTTYTPTGRVITNTYRFKGRVIYSNTKEAYPFFDYFIDEVLIRDGMQIEIGTPIAKLRDYDIEKIKSQYELQILVLEDQIAGFSSQLEGISKESQKESIERQLTIAQKQLNIVLSEKELYFSKIDSQNYLLSDVEGKIVSNSITSHSLVNSTSLLFTYIDDTSYPIIEWEMHPSEALIYNKSSKVKLVYTYIEKIRNFRDTLHSSTQFVTINKIQYDAKKERYVYTSIAPSNKDFLGSHDINVSIIGNIIALDNSVPNSAVFGEDGDKKIFIVSPNPETGQMIVKETPVTVTDDYETYLRLDYQFGINELVVVSTSKPLSHNMKVNLR